MDQSVCSCSTHQVSLYLEEVEASEDALSEIGVTEENLLVTGLANGKQIVKGCISWIQVTEEDQFVAGLPYDQWMMWNIFYVEIQNALVLNGSQLSLRSTEVYNE